MEYLNHAPFVHYVGNQPSKARDHFDGLREAKDDLLGVAIFDNFYGKFPEGDASLNMLMREVRKRLKIIYVERMSSQLSQ